MAGIPLTVALLEVRDTIPELRRVVADSAYQAGALATIAQTDLERQLVDMLCHQLAAHSSVLDLLAGLVAAVEL